MKVDQRLPISFMVEQKWVYERVSVIEVGVKRRRVKEPVIGIRRDITSEREQVVRVIEAGR